MCRVTMGHLRVNVGSPRVTIGYLNRVLLSTLDPHIFYGLENLCVCYNYKHKYDV